MPLVNPSRWRRLTGTTATSPQDVAVTGILVHWRKFPQLFPAVFHLLIKLIEKTEGAHLWFDTTMSIYYAAIHTLMGIRGMHHVPCIASHTKMMWPALWISPTTKERNLWERYLRPSSAPGGQRTSEANQDLSQLHYTTPREKNQWLTKVPMDSDNVRWLKGFRFRTVQALMDELRQDIRSLQSSTALKLAFALTTCESWVLCFIAVCYIHFSAMTAINLGLRVRSTGGGASVSQTVRNLFQADGNCNLWSL